MNKKKVLMFVVLVIFMFGIFTAIDMAFISYKGNMELVNATSQEMIMRDKIGYFITVLKFLIAGLCTIALIERKK